MLTLIILIIIAWVAYTGYKHYASRADAVLVIDNWINAVEVHDVGAVSKYFCTDAMLVGTVSRQIRTGPAIRRYFDYFANLPGVKVVSREYQIQSINGSVCIVNAMIKWMWDGLSDPVVVRMTFVIFRLKRS